MMIEGARCGVRPLLLHYCFGPTHPPTILMAEVPAAVDSEVCCHGEKQQGSLCGCRSESRRRGRQQ